MLSTELSEVVKVDHNVTCQSVVAQHLKMSVWRETKW